MSKSNKSALSSVKPLKKAVTQVIEKESETEMNPIDGLRHDLKRLLYDRSMCAPLVNVCEQLEKKTHQKRDHLAAGFLGLVGIYLIVGYFAELICNFTGFAYPAYQSFKAIRTVAKDDDTQWLTYWVVFACFSMVDFASDDIMDKLPLYWLLKSLFFLYLYAPSVHGAEKLYIHVVLPIMSHIERRIDGGNNHNKML